MDPSFDGNFFKGSVTTVVIKKITFAFEAPGSALHENAFEATEFVTPELREVIHVQMGIAGDEKIHVAIAVVVAPCRPGHKAAAAYASFFSDVFKFAVPETVIKVAAGAVSLDGRAIHQQDIHTAVVITVEESHATAGRVDHIVGLGRGNMRNR